jgi:hypothetical protein
MFRFLFGNSLISSSIIFAGKVFTIVLVVALLLNPTMPQNMAPGLRTALGFTTLVFAALGLFSCCFGFSKVMLIAGFWVIAIYSLSTSFLGMPGSFNLSSKIPSIPKILPGGLMYDEIPETAVETTNSILSADFKLPSAGGMMDKLYSYVSAPVAEAGAALNISDLSFKNTGFGGMTFNSGVLPDDAYFPKSSGKRNYYPIKDKTKDSGLMGLLQMIPIK